MNPGTDISKLIIENSKLNGNDICDGDIIVIAQKIISKSEKQLVNLDTITPTNEAIAISKIHNKDPRLIELILRESKEVVKVSEKNLIVETKHGFICANAGIDKSNVNSENNFVLLLPENPDETAKKIRQNIYQLIKKNVSIIISDTFGRPFRRGQTNVAIGVSGIMPLRSYIGEKDSYGKLLRVTEIAIVDELASSAELVMGKTSKVPVVIIRGYEYDLKGTSENKISIKDILRDKKEDLFRV